MKYYKVVNSQMSSCRLWWRQWRVKYVINQWVRPHIKYSKLFVFSDLRQARRFCFSSETIYECKVKNPIKTAPFCCYFGPENYMIMKIWKLWGQKKKYRHLMPEVSNETIEPPLGTVYVDAVKLIKPIDMYTTN